MVYMNYNRKIYKYRERKIGPKSEKRARDRELSGTRGLQLEMVLDSPEMAHITPGPARGVLGFKLWGVQGPI